MDGGTLVASGQIFECENAAFLETAPKCTSGENTLSGEDVYNDLKTSGYHHGPPFQSIVESNFEGTSGMIQWHESWISFLEAHMSFSGLMMTSNEPMLPTAAEFLKIDPKAVRAYVQNNTSSNKGQDKVTCNFPCGYNPKTHVCRSIGVEVGPLRWQPAPISKGTEKPNLEEYRFVPYISSYVPTDGSGLHSQYLFACNELVKKIETALKEDMKQPMFQIDAKNEVSLEGIESSDGKNLLKILEIISSNLENFKTKTKEYLLNYTLIAGKDILNNVLVNEESLKIILAIISENSYKKLNVVEVNRNFPVVLVPAIEIMRKYTNLNFKKSILIAPKSVVIDDEVLEEHGIQRSSDDSLKDFEKEGSHDVAISSFTCGPLSELKQLLRSLTSIIKPDGFILLFFKARSHRAEKLLSFFCGEKLQVHSVEELESTLKDENLVILSKISDSFGGFLYLLRRPTLAKQQRTVLITDENNFEWVEKVKKELYGVDSGLLWLVAKDNPVTGILGMVNCLKQEPGGERIRCVFIPHKKEDQDFPSFNLEHPFFNHLVSQNLVMNVWKNGAWGSYRHLLIKETKPRTRVEHSFVRCRNYGNLSSFEWTESRIKYAPRQNRKLVHIYYSAVNTEDVMMANGKLSSRAMLYQQQGNSAMGYEFSGREEGTGKRVCGFTPAGSMATSVLVDPAHCLEVPEKWTLEEAATVPVAYATCYYSLLTRAKLQPGESILIHSGSDGIGMAAITIALELKCEVFTTVDTEEKRDYLRKKFPQIKIENIWFSRTLSFETMILSGTDGRGVDVILNSFAGDKYQANFRCISSSGRIIEIGKHDLAFDHSKDSKIFLNNVSFHAVYLDEIFAEASVQDTMGMVRQGIKNGVVQPLERTAFGRNAIEDAFRYVEKKLHIGKVLLKMRDEEPCKSISPTTLLLPAIPESQFYYNKVYIVIGGLGGFGLEVTKWAISRGARNIVLTSRYGARTSYQHFCLKRWKDAGLNVRVSTMNVAKRDEAEKLLEDCMNVGPLGGIFNSAVILKDGYLDVQTPEDFQLVCGPKSEATKTLDELTRKLCPDIDYFVCFSSIVAGRGNAGQTNYAFANSVMERICEERRKDGLHGLAIQWGIIGDVGVVHKYMGDSAIIAGAVAQSAKSCLKSLDIFCQQDCPVVASYMPVEQSKKSDQGNILKQILKILGVEDITQINMTRRLSEIGIDSIVGSQIKQMIESACDVDVTIHDILEMNLDDIKAILKNADRDKSSSQAPALITTIKINLPPTLVHRDPLVLLNEEGSGEHIFIVHIKDTNVMDFVPLAKALNKPVYALVWTTDLSSTEMESVAQRYLKLKEELQKNSDLNLRIRTLFNYLRTSSNENEVNEAVTNHLLKQRLLESYFPRGKLSSNIHLLEDSSRLLTSDVPVIKEIFTQLCSGKISVHRILSSRQLLTEEYVQQTAKIVQSII
ncbi:unnamed protein product [Larinioides sclopetarius]|uniref:Carrier domain-containing protein n=1 Tax=Larinioides sclopetarius TaxID=280406 RepID=A0AAV2AKM1_9ARAC